MPKLMRAEAPSSTRRCAIRRAPRGEPPPTARAQPVTRAIRASEVIPTTIPSLFAIKPHTQKYFRPNETFQEAADD
jgi:hypothetical protein